MKVRPKVVMPDFSNMVIEVPDRIFNEIQQELDKEYERQHKRLFKKKSLIPKEDFDKRFEAMKNEIISVYIDGHIGEEIKYQWEVIEDNEKAP